MDISLIYKNLINSMNERKNDKNNLRGGKGLKNFLAIDSVNTFDRGISVSGFVDETQKENFNAWLEKNNFSKLIQNVGFNLSLYGKDYGFYLLENTDDFFLDWGKVLSYKKVAGILEECYIETNEIETQTGDTKIKKVIKFWIEKNETENSYETKNAYVKLVDGKWFVDANTIYIYKKTNAIPIFVFENNALAESDVPSWMDEEIELLDFYGKEIKDEWIYTRTQEKINKLYSSTKDKKKYDEEKREGRITETASADGKIAPYSEMAISGSQSVQIIATIYNFLEDKILKYSCQFRDASVGGNNKLNFELMSFNQKPFEYMLNKKEYREDQLQKMFLEIFKLKGLDSTKLKVKIKISELEKYKLDKMSAEVQNIKADAEIKKAQAAKARSETSNMTSPTLPILEGDN